MIENPAPTAQVLCFWRPGSQDWTWKDEYHDLINRPETKAIEKRCLKEGWHYANKTHPITLGNDGRVWDGHHRIVLAIKHGVPSLTVVEIEADADSDEAGAASLIAQAWNKVGETLKGVYSK